MSNTGERSQQSGLDDIDMIVEKYRPMLSSIGHQFRMTREEQEDAAQSTWLQLFRYASDIRDPHAIGGWLATTMRRQCLAILRRRSLEDPVPDVPEYTRPDTVPDVAESVAHRHAVRRLHEAVQHLSSREQRVIRLQLDATEPAYADISRSLDMPIGSIGPVRGRALRKLRALLPDLEPDRSWALAR